MGQGIYTAIVWGVIIPEPDDSYYDDSYYEVLEFLLINKHGSIRDSYECNNHWIGVMVADSDGNINTRYEPLPENRSNPEDPHEQIGLCFYKQAFKLSEIEQKINGVKPNCITQAKQDWEAFSLDMNELGFKLPSPELLLINDWH
jgi:hypothetical protein